MKRFTLLAILLCLAVNLFAQTIPSYVPGCGLRAWYPFTGNAIDSTLHGNDGTVYGATLTTDRFGHPNSAYYFNGISNYIYIPPATTLPTSLYIPGSLSISAWVQTSDYSHGGQEQIFWRGDNVSAHDQYMLFIVGGSIALRRDVGTGSTTTELDYPTAGIDATWHHFVATYDSVSGVMCIYKDGSLVATAVEPGIESYTTTTFFNVIGAVNFSPAWQYFLGKIDDIGVWSRALSVCEVRELYYSTAGICLADTSHSRRDTSSCGPILLTGRTDYINHTWSTSATGTAISATTSGIYWVRSYNDNCHEAFDTFNVTISPTDSTHNHSFYNVCSAAAPLSLSAPSGFSSYLWNTGATTPGISVNTSGTYWVLASGGCSIQRDTFFVTITPTDTIFRHRDTTVCSAVPTMQLNAPSGYSSYSWSTGSTANNITISASGTYWVQSVIGCNVAIDTFVVSLFFTDTTYQSSTVSPCSSALPVTLTGPAGYLTYHWNTGASSASINTSIAGIYWVYAINSCGVLADTFHVSVINNDTTYNSTDSAKCIFDGTIALNAPAGYTDYLWNTGSSSTTLNAWGPGIYWVYATSGCSTLVDTFHVSFISDDTTYRHTDTAVCAGLGAITLAVAPGYTSYYWNTGSIASFITISLPGDYWVYERIAECHLQVDSFTVSFKPLPLVSLGSDTIICSGTSITLTSSQPPGATYLWSNGSTTADINLSQAGPVTLTVTLNGCSTTDTINIDVISVPQCSLGPDTVICNQSYITLAVNVPGNNYTWSGGSNGTTLDVNESGVYWCTIANECGSSTDSVKVTFENCNVGLPTAFSPNGDGENDVLYARGAGITAIEFSIYNRFGQLIFHTKDMTRGWDGTFNGEPQPVEVYAYVIKAIFADGAPKIIKGGISLLR